MEKSRYIVLLSHMVYTWRNLDILSNYLTWCTDAEI